LHERIKVTDGMLSQAVELIKLDEEDLYEKLGLSFMLSENLKAIDFLIQDFERHPARSPSKDKYRIANYMRKTEVVRETTLSLLTLREDLIKSGRKYFRKFRRSLFQKICVEKEACKWSKEILGDTKLLLLELIPLVSVALGVTFHTIVITVAILIVKWGIIKFCKCSKP